MRTAFWHVELSDSSQAPLRHFLECAAASDASGLSGAFESAETIAVGR